MKKEMKGHRLCRAFIMISLFSIHSMVIATEPRVTPGLLSPEKLELFAYEYPPLVSLDMPSGGLYPELIQAALDKEMIEIMITILPVKSLVKYYLLQDNAIVITGEEWDFSEEERKQLIVVPFCIVKGGYYYYRTAGSRVVSIDKDLFDVRGLTYGAQKGEDVSVFMQSGIPVKYGNVVTLYNQLKSGEIDFMSAPDLSKHWIDGKPGSEENREYTRMSNSSWEVFPQVVINKNNIEAEKVARALAQGLDKIMQDGTYMDILEEYYGEGNLPKDFIHRLERRLKRSAH